MFDDNTLHKYKLFLEDEKKRKKKVLAYKIAILVIFILFWELSARTGFSDPFLTSSPGAIAGTIAKLIRSGELFRHVFVTTAETTIGFVLGTALGIMTAAALWYFPFASKVCEPYLITLNALPKVALGPVIIVWAGANYCAIIFMTLLISLIVTIISVYGSLISTDKEKLTLLKTFNASRMQMFTKAVLPHSVPGIFNALKINVGMSWVGVIMGEFLVSKAGLGYLIIYGSNVFNLNLVMTAVVLLAFIAALMYFFVALFERRALRKRQGIYF
jgi:NitT/TauT family transport system permease protein